MSEPQNAPSQPVDDDQGSHASVGKDAAEPGGGRTESETAVDDALGAGDETG